MQTKTILLITLAFTLSLVSSESPWLPGVAAESQPSYATMSTSQLKQWLEEHNVPLPTHAKHNELRNLVAENWYSASAWTYDQYHNAQRTLSDIQNIAFESWDESSLREFLLRQGIVAPKGPRDQLVLLVKSHYKGYESAAISFADRVGASASSLSAETSKTAEGFASKASIGVVHLETEVARALDRSKDYIYSTWDDNMLRTYLESKGLIKTKSEHKRDEMLVLMESHYNKVANPIWEAWSDSYMMRKFPVAGMLYSSILNSTNGSSHMALSSLTLRKIVTPFGVSWRGITMDLKIEFGRLGTTQS